MYYEWNATECDEWQAVDDFEHDLLGACDDE